MAKSKSTIDTLASLAGTALPAPAQAVLGNSTLFRLTLGVLIIGLTLGILSLSWENGKPSLRLDRVKLNQYKEQTLNEIKNFREGKPLWTNAPAPGANPAAPATADKSVMGRIGSIFSSQANPNAATNPAMVGQLPAANAPGGNPANGSFGTPNFTNNPWGNPAPQNYTAVQPTVAHAAGAPNGTYGQQPGANYQQLPPAWGAAAPASAPNYAPQQPATANYGQAQQQPGYSQPGYPQPGYAQPNSNPAYGQQYQANPAYTGQPQQPQYAPGAAQPYSQPAPNYAPYAQPAYNPQPYAAQPGQVYQPIPSGNPNAGYGAPNQQTQPANNQQQLYSLPPYSAAAPATASQPAGNLTSLQPLPNPTGYPPAAYTAQPTSNPPSFR